MSTYDISTILGIVVNLVSDHRDINQERPEVRDFKVATSKLIACLSSPEQVVPTVLLTPTEQVMPTAQLTQTEQSTIAPHTLPKPLDN